MPKRKREMAKVEDIDTVLDKMGIPKGAARDKVKTYCAAKVNSSQGQCLPTDELGAIATSYYDGYSESLRGG